MVSSHCTAIFSQIAGDTKSVAHSNLTSTIRLNKQVTSPELGPPARPFFFSFDAIDNQQTEWAEHRANHGPIEVLTYFIV